MPESSSDAAHEFGALNTLLLVVILGLCILSAYLIKQNSFYYLPESAAAIVVGLIVGCLARVVYPSAEELNFLSLEPQLFFFLLLPPIIFEAGYALRKRDFFANFWTISLFTVFGTIISTFVIGYLVYGIGLLGLVSIDTSSPTEALLFGALISAVDPVATLSIMGNPELNCDPLLYSLVFGESVLNDAVAIVLFKTFRQFYESGEVFSGRAVAAVMFNFSVVSLGSVAVGVGIGLVCSYLCKHTNMRKYPEYEISMLFLFAYGSYSFSEALQLSGIMSLFFCGIVLSHYNSHNLSSTSQVTAHNIFKSMAVLSEYFVFLYIGMGLFTGRFKHINFTFFLLCTIFCLIGRVANIFPLSVIANLGRQKPITLKMQGVMWFAGLRGAISFALSQNMPGEHKEMYISTTLSIVIFTTVVCGGLTEPMMSRMGMRRAIDSIAVAVAEPSSSKSEHGAQNSSSSSKQRKTVGGGGVASSGGNNKSGADEGDDDAHDEEKGSGSDQDDDHEHTLLVTESGKTILSAGSDVANQQHKHLTHRGVSLITRFEHEFMKPIFGGGFESGDDLSALTASTGDNS